MAYGRGQTIREAEFDRRLLGYMRALVSVILLVTVVGIPLIPFWLLWSLRYAPMAYDRLSARLTPTSLETTSGVYFRKEGAIPLDRITDIRLHDDPLMRMFGLSGVRVETAGQGGASASPEGNLIGVIDSPGFRDAILDQREALSEGRSASAAAMPAVPADSDESVLVEIRDLLRSIDAKTQG